jgi:O-antigen ligase
LLVFLPLSFEMIVQSLTTLERLMAFNFHPNLLGLQLAGFLCVIVWKFMTGGWMVKLFSGLLGLACMVVIFLTSSRGAIVGVAAGFAFTGVASIGAATKRQRKRMLWISALAVALLTVSFGFIYSFDSTKDAFDGLDQLLALSSAERGLDSGMTGRVDLWHQILRVFSDGTWLFGHGVRSSDVAFVDPSIDNSYLVILYDMGIVPLILIVWRFVIILRNVTRACFHDRNAQARRLYIACGMFLVVLLVTAIVERSLFAVGNPFSLLAFLFFAAPAQFWKGQQETSPDLQSASLGNRLAHNT